MRRSKDVESVVHIRCLCMYIYISSKEEKIKGILLLIYVIVLLFIDTNIIYIII